MVVSRARRHPPVSPSQPSGAPPPRGPLDAETLLLELGPVMVPTDAPLDHVLHGEWELEVKYNGDRLAVAKLGKTVAMRGRGRKGMDHRADFRNRYPEVASAVRGLRRDVVLDGEVVGQDARGGTLRSYLGDEDPRRVGDRRFVAFDVRWLDGQNLQHLAYRKRREILTTLIEEAQDPRLALAERLSGPLPFALARAVQLDVEGVVAKRASSHYAPGSSDAWRRLKPGWVTTMAILGYVAGASGKLEKVVLDAHAGADVGSRLWLPVARVSRDALQSALAPDEQAVRDLRRGGTFHEVRARHSAQVRYPEREDDGTLTDAVYQVRVAGRPTEPGVIVREAIPGRANVPPPPGPDGLERAEEPAFRGAKVSRLQLFEYYRALWPALTPYVIDRPLVLERAPNAPPSTLADASELPAGLARTAHGLVLTGPEGLVPLLNDNVIGLRLAPARARNAEQPDWVAFSIRAMRPPTTARIATAALELQKRLANIHLTAFAKTSGDGGLDVVVPLRGPLLREEARSFARQVIAVLEEDLPELVGTGRSRVQVTSDVTHDAPTAAPYLCRPLSGAPVSLPLEWSEVPHWELHAEASWKHAVIRLGESDPFAPLLTTSQMLPR